MKQQLHQRTGAAPYHEDAEEFKTAAISTDLNRQKPTQSCDLNLPKFCQETEWSHLIRHSQIINETRLNLRYNVRVGIQMGISGGGKCKLAAHREIALEIVGAHPMSLYPLLALNEKIISSSMFAGSVRMLLLAGLAPGFHASAACTSNLWSEINSVHCEQKASL